MWHVATIEVTGDEPVTLAEVKQQLRVDHADDDELLQRLISVAREKAENLTGLLLREQTIEITFTDGFPSRLPRAPISDVTSIAFADGPQSSSQFGDFDFFTDLDVPRLRPSLSAVTWPQLYAGGRVTISAQGGYAPSDVPQALRHALLLLVAHWYANREAASRDPLADIPLGVRSLCADYRLSWL